MQDPTTNTMEGESGAEPQPGASSGYGIFTAVEDGMSTVGRASWEFFHDLPGHGVVVGGAIGLGAAMLVGVAELAAACFTAYVSYRMFGYGESLSEAVENAIRFESGSLSKEEINKPIVE